MKILLVDDHELFRAGLRLLLLSIDGSMTVLEACGVGEALAATARHPDLQLCLLDLGLKDGGGLDALRQIKSAVPQAAIVVVSALEDTATVYRCIEAGAMSFVPKSAAPRVLTEALQQVLRGAIYFPAQIIDDMPERPSPRPVLTPRQLAVLGELSLGLPTKLIASRLSISDSTVNEHIALIFRALRVRNRTQAVIAAGRLKLLDP